ncbi:MAG: hypothetical protein KDK24_00940 [Pseudooceanicola sp.]|nr:hypothetical protein [Pseudooceanicola sp.]
MRALLLPLAILIATSATAEEQKGRSLMEEGMKLFFEGLKDEMEPTLRDFGALADEFGPPMQRFLREMGPALAEIIATVEDWTQYQTPEILPNGDILIRRKVDKTPDDQPAKPAPNANPTTDL